MSDTTTQKMIPACGGRLIDLVASANVRGGWFAIAKELPSIQLSERSVCDLELLATGAFSPLDRFMTLADYARVLYRKARRSEIQNFTGIDDPYEAPLKPELVLNTVTKSAEKNAERVVQLLRERGFFLK